MTKYRFFVPQETPVGRHAMKGQEGSNALALFKGPVRKNGTREIKVANIVHQKVIDTSKSYKGKVGAKTRAKQEAFKNGSGNQS